MITQERLKELLDYDPGTGVFTWRKSPRSTVKIGDIAGWVRPDGYVEIGIKGMQYKAHRLVFLWMEGYFPEHGVDHRNRVRVDNRWKNLREASKQCNARNCGNYTNNTSGVKGVRWDTWSKKWLSRIRFNQKLKFLGRYDSFDDAVLARLKAECQLGWEGCDSSSPAYQYATREGLI